MPKERGSAGNTMTAPSGMQQWEQELADEIPSAPPLLSNRVFWRRVELALRSSAAVAAVLAVNYLTDQTWLPAGNLAAAFAVVTCGGGSIGSALNLANIEAMLLACVLLVPVGYALTHVEDETSWRIALPLATFGLMFLLIQTRLIDGSVKGAVGAVSFLGIFTPRALCQADRCDAGWQLHLIANVALACGASALVHCVPLPLPPRYEFACASSVHLARKLRARARGQSALLIAKLVRAAEESSGPAFAELETLSDSLHATLAQLEPVAQAAMLELALIGRGPEANRLLARDAIARSEAKLIAQAVLIVTHDASGGPLDDPESAPLAPKAAHGARQGLRAVEEALRADGTTAAQLRALVTSCYAAYTGAARRAIGEAGGASQLLRSDALIFTLMDLAGARVAALEAAASVPPTNVLARLRSYAVFLNVLKTWRRPWLPLCDGPAHLRHSWRYTLTSLKFAAGMASAALWISEPDLVARSGGRGVYVGINYAFVFSAGLGGRCGAIASGIGAVYKKAHDRILANGVALISALIVLEVMGVEKVSVLVGTNAVYVVLVLLNRTPSQFYLWTCMAFTFSLAAFEMLPELVQSTALDAPQIFVAWRIALIGLGIAWWMGWEAIFSLLGGSFDSNQRMVWAVLLGLRYRTRDFLANSVRLLAAAETASGPTTELASRPPAADPAAAVSATLAAFEADVATAQREMANLPFELDLAGTNFPDVTPLVHPAVTRNTSQCVLLACIARSLGACRGRDAAMLRAAFFEPATAAFTAACEAARLVTLAHKSGSVPADPPRSSSPFRYLDHFRRFVRLRAALWDAYCAALPQLLDHRPSDDSAADGASQVAVSMAVWALLGVCAEQEKKRECALRRISGWALWADPEAMERLDRALKETGISADPETPMSPARTSDTSVAAVV